MYYRFEVLTDLGVYVGPFNGIDFFDAGLDDGWEYELTEYLNANLPIPQKAGLGRYWFTEKGYKEFGPYMARLIETVMDEGIPGYIRDARIISMDVDTGATYRDEYQIAIPDDVEYQVEMYF